MRRVRTSSASQVRVGDRSLTLGDDIVATAAVNARVDAPLVFVGEGSPADVERMDLSGKAVAAVMSAPSRPIPANVSLRPVRYAWASLAERARYLAGRGAVAVIMVSDPVADSGWAFGSMWFTRGTYGIDSTGAEAPNVNQTPILWAHGSTRSVWSRPGQRFTATLVAENFLYPSVNVVARVPGTDPVLSKEIVLFSGHQDHDGVRKPINGDSIYNGADDNGSVSVGLLAIGRAFRQHPGKRTALFVWHGAEERGLLGSRWFAYRPMVPREAIAAVLNADLIGSNSPDSAALLGVRPPHRNSSELVAMALEANRRVSRFALDTLWDAPSHPEGWYFRSDHVPYARHNIPVVYFSTLPHPLYHTPKDEPNTINYPKLTRMTQWMYATGWLVANAPERPKADPGFRLER
jgi:hypothetical protein